MRVHHNFVLCILEISHLVEEKNKLMDACRGSDVPSHLNRIRQLEKMNTEVRMGDCVGYRGHGRTQHRVHRVHSSPFVVINWNFFNLLMPSRVREMRKKSDELNCHHRLSLPNLSFCFWKPFY